MFSTFPSLLQELAWVDNPWHFNGKEKIVMDSVFGFTMGNNRFLDVLNSYLERDQCSDRSCVCARVNGRLTVSNVYNDVCK